VIDLAYAMGTAPGGGAGGGAPVNPLMQFLPFILIFVILYFLMIRPQQKRSKQHRDFLAALEKGDEVITSGGIHGKVTGLTDTVVTLEVGQNVRIKVERSNIAGRKPKAPEKSATE